MLLSLFIVELIIHGEIKKNVSDQKNLILYYYQLFISFLGTAIVQNYSLVTTVSKSSKQLFSINFYDIYNLIIPY